MISISTIFLLGVVAILLSIVWFVLYEAGKMLLVLARVKKPSTWRDKCTQVFAWMLFIVGLGAIVGAAVLWITRHVSIT
jgi:hypothetical protein